MTSPQPPAPPYVSPCEAIRIIVRAQPRSPKLAVFMTDHWIKTDRIATEEAPSQCKDKDSPQWEKAYPWLVETYGPKWRKVVSATIAAFRLADKTLRAALLDPNVRIAGNVNGEMRQIRDDERGDRLYLKTGTLATPFGKSPENRPAIIEVEICAGDLEAYLERERANLRPRTRVLGSGPIKLLA